MNKKSNLTKIIEIKAVNLSDILYFAEANGYFWNQACDILQDVRFGKINTEIFTDAYDFGFNDDLKKIMLSFFEAYNISEIYLTKDYAV